jgi:anaphase-promoting complex subunit 6
VCVEEDDEKMEQSVLGARLFAHKVLQEQYEFNRIAGFYNAVGLCYDNLDNRIRCIRAFTTAVRIDPCCLEALQYVCSNGLITKKEKKTLFSSISFVEGHEALRRHYRLCLLDDESCSGNGAGSSSSSSSGSSEESGLTSAAALTRKAEYYFGTLQQPGEAYRLIRQAYALDPFDKRCLGVYIGTLIELGLKTELFYLAHELTNTYPKLALSWYAVGCYYWCCQKLELAQKYLQKCNKMNKRSATALVALGHVLSAQEESEHAISAFRAASRLIPADHRPIVLMAKELVRTNYLSLALHLLSSALEMAPNDALVLNELGVIYLKLDRLEDAVEHLSKAVAAVLQASRDSLALAGHGSSAKDGSRNVLAKPAYCKIQGGEIFSNYATALRRSGEYAEALGWYQLSLTESANDANTHACVAFTLHLMRRFDEAVSAYHRALSAAPNSTFCAEMLTRALEDSFNYPSAAEDGDGDDVDDENFHTENTFAGGSPGPLQLGEQNIEHLDITHGSGVLWDIRTTT